MKYAQAGKGSSLNVHIIKIPIQGVNNVLNFAACRSNRFLGLILDSILLFHFYLQHPVPNVSRLVFLTFEKFSVSAKPYLVVFQPDAYKAHVYTIQSINNA